MGRYQHSIYSRFLLFIGVVIVVFANSCRPSSDSSEVEVKVKEVVELSKGMVDTRGGIATMRFLDSAIGGTELALKSRFVVYLQKYDIAHGSMGDDILASRYADSMLLLLVEDKKVFDTGEIFKAYLLKANVSYATERFDEALAIAEFSGDFVFERAYCLYRTNQVRFSFVYSQTLTAFFS